VHTSAAPTIDAYEAVLLGLRQELTAVAKHAVGGVLDVTLHINTQGTNPYAAKRQYLLGSGTCLELGEEGFVGRGNGPSGLISLYRAKGVEAVYGKNPTYHSGKVYTLYAEQIARDLHAEQGVGSTVTIVAGHSNPLRKPTHVSVDVDGPVDPTSVKATVQRVLATTDHVTLAVDDGRLIPR
jgi:S-adenosylmethionine synthetase